jgi:hypothetical protein
LIAWATLPIATADSGNVGYLPAGTGAVATTVQGKLRESVSVKDRGALIDGTTDDSTAIQNAVDTSTVVKIPAGTGDCMMRSQVVISSPCHLIIETTIKPKVNASSAGTPLFKITSSDVVIEFRKGGGIDGISTSYQNWNGIAAEGASGLIERVFVRDGKFANIGIDKTTAQVINFTGVVEGYIGRNKLTNCGVVSNVSGGGEMIYTAGCEDVVVDSNTSNTVGSTFINSSCNLNCSFVKNKAKNTTLFAFKGGYGASTAITANVTPSSTTFSVAKTATTTKFFKVGSAFMFPRSTFPCPKGVIKTIVDNATYYTITTASVMPAVPTALETMQIMDTNSEWVGNNSIFCGDNAYDQNGVYGLNIEGGTVDFAGAYTAVGTYSGLWCGVWVGYDPQGANISMDNDGVMIKGVKVRHSKGAGIAVFVSNDVMVASNQVHDFNTSASAGFNGIQVNRLGYHIQTGAQIYGNQVAGSVAGSCAVSMAFTTQGQIQDNLVVATDGIQADSCQNTQITGNNVSTTTNGKVCILVSNSGGNPSSGIFIDENVTAVADTTSANLSITDPAVTNFQLGTRNVWGGSATAKVISLNANATGIYPHAGQGGMPDANQIRSAVSVGATQELCRFVADNGTAGGATVTGFAWSGTFGLEAFRVTYLGNTVANAVSFTSVIAAGGGAFLASGDFTVSVSGAYVVCNYTNNEATNVRLVADVVTMARF